MADVEVRRSKRRRRTVSAYRDGGRIIVLVPDRFSRAEEARWVASMVADITSREDRARSQGPRSSDAALMQRALELNDRHLDGAAVPASIRWVSTMSHRWASCTAVDRSIRISDQVRTSPEWVLDYLIVHELAHLLVHGHGRDFWDLVERYPRTERARGYLEGLSAARQAGAGTSASNGLGQSSSG